MFRLHVAGTPAWNLMTKRSFETPWRGEACCRYFEDHSHQGKKAPPVPHVLRGFREDERVLTFIRYFSIPGELFLSPRMSADPFSDFKPSLHSWDTPYLIIIYLSQHFIMKAFKYIKMLNFAANSHTPAI